MGEARTKVEQRVIIQNLISESAPVAIRKGGGAMVLNSENIAYWTLFPRPPTASSESWAAHFVSRNR